MFFFSSHYADVSEMSSRLTSESRIYADKARDLNRQVSLFFIAHFSHLLLHKYHVLIFHLLLVVLL